MGENGPSYLCITITEQLSVPEKEYGESPQHLRNNIHSKRTKEFRLKMGLQHHEE